MPDKSILTKVIEELKTAQNHDASLVRCKTIIKELESELDARVISFFSSEEGADESSLINDEDAFVIENLLSIPTTKKHVMLIVHSNGGFSLSAERIIEVCKTYCKNRNDGSKFYVFVPKKAKSAATIVALGADQIFLRDTAELGPVDPQFLIQDEGGNIRTQPAYLFVDALENLGLRNEKRRFWSSGEDDHTNNQHLAKLPGDAKIKLLEQCNYPLYVNSKNELGLSDSIVEKIAKQKIAANNQIRITDFDIFRDPHITKSHGRLINFADLQSNSLYTQKVIQELSKFFPGDEQKFKKVDAMLWELYVRERMVLNDVGNHLVKHIESTDELFMMQGMKKGQPKGQQSSPQAAPAAPPRPNPAPPNL